LLGTLNRVRRSRSAAISLYLGRLGYAVPGGVIAVGLLVPFAVFDNSLDAWMRANMGISTGLLFTGSIWLLIAAYMIRFLAAAIGAYEGGMSSVGTNIDAAARTLGADVPGLVRRVHMPIVSASLLTAGLIVFVDVMKELPATLIMRPFNYDTLAVQAYRLASDERLDGAAVPSLVIAAVGLLPVILLCRRMRRLGRVVLQVFAALSRAHLHECFIGLSDAVSHRFVRVGSKDLSDGEKRVDLSPCRIAAV
jgi:iron(III) transport system permease protein